MKITREVKFLSEFITSGKEEDFVDNETTNDRYKVLKSKKSVFPTSDRECFNDQRNQQDI